MNNSFIDSDIEQSAQCLKALAHPIRLSILQYLKDGAKCVKEIEEFAGSTQSNISQHLAVMKERGILKSYRDKNQIYYFVDNWRIFQLLSIARELFCSK